MRFYGFTLCGSLPPQIMYLQYKRRVDEVQCFGFLPWIRWNTGRMRSDSLQYAVLEQHYSVLLSSLKSELSHSVASLKMCHIVDAHCELHPFTFHVWDAKVGELLKAVTSPAMSEQSQKTCGQCFSPDRSQEKSTCPTLTEKVKERCLRSERGKCRLTTWSPRGMTPLRVFGQDKSMRKAWESNPLKSPMDKTTWVLLGFPQAFCTIEQEKRKPLNATFATLSWHRQGTRMLTWTGRGTWQSRTSWGSRTQIRRFKVWLASKTPLRPNWIR